MKKLIIFIIVIANLCFSLIANATAEVDLQEVQSTLQQNCGQLKTDIGTIEIIYKVIEKTDYYEVQAHLDYGLFNDIQFGEYKHSVKLKATDQIKTFTQSIFKTISTLYPKEKWKGFYSAEFDSILGYKKSIMYFNWQSDNNQFTWRTDKDSSWDLAICEWLEK